jgi:glycosyltransferase involved in cell wall biosynthesis
MTVACVDGYNLSLPHGSGIATYARSLIDAVQRNANEAQILFGPPRRVAPSRLLRETMVADAFLKPRLAETIMRNRKVQVALAGFGRRASFVGPSGQIHWPEGVNRPPADGFWLSEDIFRIAARAFNERRTFTPVGFTRDGANHPDVMHWTHPMPLRGRGVQNIYTIHDLIPLKLPHTTLDDKQRFFDLCQKIIRTADHIITVSETTRNDVITMLGVDGDRVTNTWQSADIPGAVLERDPAAAADMIENTFDLSWKGYLIYFGAVEPKKNLTRLLEGYLRSGVKTPLVVVGGRGWLNDQDLGFIQEIASSDSRMGKQLLWYDYLPRNILFDLVRGARATIFPSLYEGFGLPVLESMTLGTPVIAAGTGSLSEVAGDAALFVDPYDVDDIARGIRQMDVDDDVRHGLSEAGLERARLFSPEAYAARLKGVYAKIGAV